MILNGEKEALYLEIKTWCTTISNRSRSTTIKI